MEIKEIDITCPCCEARLNVDVRKRVVLRWARPEETDSAGRPVVRAEDWDDALGRVQRRLGQGEDKFDASLQREQNREADLDELFRRASEKARGGDDEDEEGPLG